MLHSMPCQRLSACALEGIAEFRTTGLVCPPVQSTQACHVNCTGTFRPKIPGIRAHCVPRKASANSRTERGMVADQNSACKNDVGKIEKCEPDFAAQRRRRYSRSHLPLSVGSHNSSNNNNNRSSSKSLCQAGWQRVRQNSACTPLASASVDCLPAS